MKKQIFFLLVALMLTAVVLPPVSAQTGEKLFQQALLKEKAAGDLREAIALYEKVLEDKNVDRVTGARAQLRIGLCFEKMGRAEAEKAYRSVISQYPEQREAVAQARDRLNELVKSSARQPEGLRFRQVWADPPETYGGGVSPDGAYVSFIDWKSVEIAAHDIETGRTWNVTDEGFWGEHGQFPDASVWSPDSRQIASFWLIDYESGRQSELRLSDREGGPYRVLVKSEDVMAPIPECWSRDGKTIWGVRGVPDNSPGLDVHDQTTWDWSVVQTSVPEGKVNYFKSWEKKMCFSIDESPDGRYLAVSVSQEKHSRVRDILILSADGEEEIAVTSHPADDWGAKWSADGKSIVFISDRTGAAALWMVPFYDGRLQGDAMLLQAGLPARFTPLGIAHDGTYYYSMTNQMGTIYTCEMDMETGKLISQPEKLRVGIEGMNYKPRWSPDGSRLIYFSITRSDGHPKTINSTVVTHHMADDREERLELDDFLVNSGVQWYYHTLSADGSSLIGPRKMSQVYHDFSRINLRDGHTDTLLIQNAWDLEATDRIGFWPRLSEDNRHLYYLSGDTRAFVRLDVESKKPEELFRTEEPIYLAAFSPDLKSVAFRHWHQNANQLWLLSFETGKARMLGNLNEGVKLGLFVWTPDGRYILCRAADALWRIHTDGTGSFEKCELDVKERYYVQVHPDGRHIAFMQYTGNYAEVWAMENYQPAN